MWRQLCILSLLGQTFAHPARTLGRLQVRQEEEVPDEPEPFDPSDLSWITRLAAIGDSYSAGIGAGDRLGSVVDALDPHSDATREDYSCSRYDQAYPYLINNDERLGDPSTRNFQFKSCSGALTQDVLDEQIPAIDSEQQAILLSVGGNDVELTNILNQCVFQWAVVNQEQVEVAKAAAFDKEFAWAFDFDWDSLGRGCEAQLAHSRSLIDGEDFSKKLDEVLEATKPKLAEDGIVYFTGYGKFFGEDLTLECDQVSWSTWIYKAWNMFQPEAKLTKANRKTMNDLVDAVNSKLEEAAGRAGDNVRFINYDSYIEEFNGRFCEPGVDESTDESNTSPGGALNGTFEGTQDIFAQITRLTDPDATLTHHDKVEVEPQAEIPGAVFAEVNAAGVSEIQVPGFLPDGYGRVFHPQILLHEIIASRVIYEMANDNSMRNGFPEIPEVLTIDTCEYTPPDDGDEPDDPPENPPENPPEEPIEELRCTGPDVSPTAYISQEAMQRHADTFCLSVTLPLGLAVRPDTGMEFETDTYDGAYLSLKSEGLVSLDGCKKNFYQIINGCVPAANNPMNWKFGGEYEVSGALYKINIAGPAVDRRTEADGGPMHNVYAICQGGKGHFSDAFNIRGAGWENSNYGETLITKLRECMGSNPTSWEFHYFDNPGVHGLEWSATGLTTIGQMDNCFAHAVRASGGPPNQLCEDLGCDSGPFENVCL
ncbi:hypothetical protein FQN54_001484 [Arachnomyces sp. PD_36]|nr:hypothetical protein FQN54_001484 [Arachnomyces sp. PD_36]